MFKFTLSQKFKSILLGFIGVGLISIGITFYLDVLRGWSLLLSVGVFILLTSIGGTFFTAIQFVTGSTWSVVVRRVSEMMVVVLPLALVIIGIVVIGGLSEVYHWAHYVHCKHSGDCANFVADSILDKKIAYLNPLFFIVRILMAFGVLYLFGSMIKNKSILQDTTKDPEISKSILKWSAAYIPVFGYLVLMLAIDLLMSVEPHWYSTMFSVYVFSGIGCASISAIIILIYIFQKNDTLSQVNAEHYHDLGKYLLGFIMLWDFIAFSQFMLIWYSNLPEETIYLERRLGRVGNEPSHWDIFTYLFWIGHCILPFLFLLSRNIKRNANKLVLIAIFCLFICFCDIIWMVYGGLQPSIKGFPFSWGELGGFVGMLGAFGYLYFSASTNVSVAPIGDPNLDKSLKFYQPF